MKNSRKLAVIFLTCYLVAVLTACDDKSGKTDATNATQPADKESPNIQGTIATTPTPKAAPQKIILDAEAFLKLEDVHQYNVLFFKFNKQALQDPQNLAYWIALNSCTKAGLSSNEFEWPKIIQEYTGLIDTTLAAMPTTLKVTLRGYLGQYDMNTQSFPLTQYISDTHNEFKVDKINLDNGSGSLFCNKSPNIHGYAINFAQPLDFSIINMNQAAAQQYVAQHAEAHSREVTIKIEAEVTGLLNANSPQSAEFTAIPKRIELLDSKNKDAVLLNLLDKG